MAWPWHISSASGLFQSCSSTVGAELKGMGEHVVMWIEMAEAPQAVSLGTILTHEVTEKLMQLWDGKTGSEEMELFV